MILGGRRTRAEEGFFFLRLTYIEITRLNSMKSSVLLVSLTIFI